MEYDLDEYDYLMVFRPYENDGDMYLHVHSIIPNNDHPEGWPDFVIFSMMLMSTAYAMMEEDEELRIKVMTRLEQDMDAMKKDNEQKQPIQRYSKADGSNVIKLTPFTKTKGNE